MSEIIENKWPAEIKIDKVYADNFNKLFRDSELNEIFESPLAKIAKGEQDYNRVISHAKYLKRKNDLTDSSIDSQSSVLQKNIMFLQGRKNFKRYFDNINTVQKNTLKKGLKRLRYHEYSVKEPNAEDNFTFNNINISKDDAKLSGKSLLEKTDSMFQAGKYHTMLNRFYDNSDDAKETYEIQTANTKEYGISRGRNLLKANRIEGDNPYCRVWTQLNRYHRFEDAIRAKTYGDVKYNKTYRVDETTRLTEYTPLLPSGRVKIAPTNADDLKKCMFSIENLAWKGYNFNRQKGPHGGRIMWFPPYNLKFNEQVTANWNANKFIGRGEDIYTYTNTERNGTLSFTLLIDHPSVVNEYNRGMGLEAPEEDVLRFFAGCDDVPIPDIPKEDVILNLGKVQTTTNTTKLTYYTAIFFPRNVSGTNEIFNNDKDVLFNYLYEGNFNGYQMNEKSNLCAGTIPSNGWPYAVDKETVVAKETEEESEEKAEDIKKDELFKDDPSYSFSLNGHDTKVWDTRFFKKNIKGDINPEFYIPFEDLYKINNPSAAIDENTPSGNLGGFLRNKHGSKSVKVTITNYLPEDTPEVYRERLFKNRYEKTSMWLSANAGIETLNIKDGDEKLISIENDSMILERIIANCVLIEWEIDLDKFRRLTGADAYNVKKVFNTPNFNTSSFVKSQIQQSLREFEEKASNDMMPEYEYFRDLEKKDNTLYETIKQKIAYFNPAFHSITPEGFNERLTFLQQCTRQGPTGSATEVSSFNQQGYGNLAFGRPPYCVLRIGDFFHTKILIDSVSIDYAENQWDLNPEGIGIQPMMANISLNIKFIGGSDIAGPISELQNAVSFNYYSNTSMYDNRAVKYVQKEEDEVEVETEETENHIEIEVDDLLDLEEVPQIKINTDIPIYVPKVHPLFYMKKQDVFNVPTQTFEALSGGNNFKPYVSKKELQDRIYYGGNKGPFFKQN